MGNSYWLRPISNGMNLYDAKINQLVNENTTGLKRIFVRTFSLSPPSGIVGKTGKLFGFIEIESSHPDTPDLIDLIIEEIQDNFYYPKDLAVDQNYANVAEQFEAALKNANISIATFIETRQISLNLEKINIVIALSSDKELHFTSIGNVGVLLFFADSKIKYRIINILESSDASYKIPNPLKLFSQVISGKMRPQDILFLTTANIFDYFSLEKIKNIITEDKPDKGIKKLNHLLETMNSNESFGALAVKLEKKVITEQPIDNIANFDYSKAASQDSIKELIRTESETAKLLTPSLMPEIKKYATSFKAAFKNYTNKIKSSGGSLYEKQKNNIRRTNLPKPKINLPKVKLPKPNFNIGSRLRQASQNSVSSLKKISAPVRPKMRSTFNSLARQPILNKILEFTRSLLSKLLNRFNRLPRSSKLLFIISIILGLMFSYSIIWLGIKNTRETRIENVNQIIVEVGNKVNEAQASLIFRDENLARDLLITARDEITGINSKSKAQTEQINQLIFDIESQLFDLRHMVDIADPVQVVNFQNLDSQASIADLAILRRSTAYTQNKNNFSIYKANLNNRVLGSIFVPESNTGQFTMGATLNDNEILFFNEKQNAFLLNPNNDTLQNLTIDLPDNANIVDVTSFNNRLYVLDVGNSQIYRYARVTGGFGGQNKWISEGGINLSDGVSIVVDGSVYVLKSNGEILKFQNGRIVDFRVATIDPPFNAPTRLKTSENSNFLYILDPPEKRLVVLDKEGNLVNQYFSAKFDDLKDFLIIESEKEMYVLNGTVIYGVPAEHL